MDTDWTCLMIQNTSGLMERFTEPVGDMFQVDVCHEVTQNISRLMERLIEHIGGVFQGDVRHKVIQNIDWTCCWYVSGRCAPWGDTDRTLVDRWRGWLSVSVVCFRAMCTMRWYRTLTELVGGMFQGDVHQWGDTEHGVTAGEEAVSYTHLTLPTTGDV